MLSELKATGSVSSSARSVDMSSGKTLLMIAAMEGDYIACTILVNRGVDLDAQDAVGFTALMYAVRDGHEDIVKLLLYSGCNPSLASKSGYSPMICAAQSGFTSIVLMLSEFVSVNDQDEDGMTPLMCACINNHMSTVSVLLQLGADPFLRDKAGNTAVVFALRHDSVSVINCFLQKNIPVMYSMHGEEVSALYTAASCRQYQMCAVLLSYDSSFDSFIHILLFSPNCVAQDVVLNCLIEVGRSLPEAACRRIRHALSEALFYLCNHIATAYSDGAKLPASLSRVVEVAVWCVRCTKVIARSDLQKLASFWNYVEATIAAISSTLRRQSEVTHARPDERNDFTESEEESDGLLNLKFLTHRQIRLLFSMMELYCAGCCAFCFESKSGCCRCYSVGDRLPFLLESCGVFFRELVLTHSSLFRHMLFFYAAAKDYVY